MPIVCVNRPNRTHRRPFRASDVGRIACYAMADGESRDRVIAALQKRCPELRVCDCDESQLLKELADILEAVLQDFVLARLGKLVRIIRVVLSRFGWGRTLLAWIDELIGRVVPELQVLVDRLREIADRLLGKTG